ncbi:2-oxoacid:acceptor oxidoreductase subunit alpha [Chlorobium ferrooxidans]|uniref:Pyruvate ferredoxin/flavodoxin oxidoreductase:Pyruvate flavodoxin/ferredoxin oxidoreductase-like n=1 Tax=Chlorobium ferrooxidans DSM 13031 TaxID=377431 RepID=Q0YRP8_9CHLB|nr:2-oxoacid:acceptor oxidoreductase subunit alpha [Chlorobium ferrooxidans]EAT58965.1 Pyruvate ferredoxin/flavodoxin oxidoreductase:Pyruvate flavodoxin/ferredoxin oxidoreductase-like [Chlorobium ferrooxidans DSM 13031]
MHHFLNDISMVFAGEAGQGLQTVTETLLRILAKSGYNVFSCTEYMSRIRGGCNTTEIRITDKKQRAYLERIDMLFALSPLAVEHLKSRINSGTLIFAEKSQFAERWDERYIDTPFRRFAVETGSPVFSNTVAAGTVFGMIGLPFERFTDYLGEQFAAKGEDTVSKNCMAAKLGYDFGRLIAADKAILLPSPALTGSSGRLLMDGNSALGIGAIAAGCNFISSYPMSPGTGLLTFLAARSKAFGIVVDQAEDEIAAVNAGIGASYCGARAIVTTSGGGFDLMQEGVSLAGMIETPIVIHIAQRPGPATGLPTRTEQGDLNLALHAGHGDFARAILAPGTLEELAESMQHAFTLAHCFQIPVFVLTDQYLLDAVTTIERRDIKRLPAETAVIKTGAGYQRFLFTDDGLSPRGVPGYGDGLVRVDSDEHDENGLITESFEMRARMVEKRLKRMKPLAEAALMPSIIGSIKEADVVVIAWGSNRGVLEEAIEILGNKRVAGIHFSQLFPLNPDVKSLLEKRALVVMENNAAGQFADLLSLQTGLSIAHRIVKTTGEPFSVEEVAEALSAFKESKRARP